jgi:hypothetical protein
MSVLPFLAVGLAAFALVGAAPGAEENTNALTRRPTVIVVAGAGGEEEFSEEFSTWATQWQTACTQAEARLISIGTVSNAPAADFEQLQRALAAELRESPAELWVVLLGHGTFDGREAKFNLRGPDLSASDLARWLDPFRRPLVIVNASSSSAPFLQKLAREGRVVITATRSGAEINFARFGKYFSAAVADPEADLDKDGQVSVLEAYLIAARRVVEFYASEGRLATEHPLLDDNGDGQGTPPDWFRGIRAVKKAKDQRMLDGLRANQIALIRTDAERQMPAETRARRDELERAVAKLRENKAAMKEDDYYQRLEGLLLEMARLYERPAESGDSP